jgi:hypothetical protein
LEHECRTVFEVIFAGHEKRNGIMDVEVLIK